MHTDQCRFSFLFEAYKNRVVTCVLFFLLFIVSANECSAANRFAVASGAWNASIWATTAGGSAGASVPGAGDQVTINASVVVNVTATANAAMLTVNGTLNFNSGADLVIANGGHVSVMSGGALIFDANGQITGGGSSAATGVVVKINAGAKLTTANAIGFMVGVNNTAITGSIATNRGSRSGPVYANDVDYVYNSNSAQNIGTGPTTMADLTVTNAGVVTASGNFTSTGVTTIDNGATLALSSRTLFLTGGGTPLVNNGGALTGSTGTVFYSSTATQNINGDNGTDYNNLSFGGSGAKTIPAGSNVAVAGNWATGNAAITFSGDANVAVTGAISGVAAITMGSGTLTAGGTTTSAFGNTGAFNRGTGTVVYNRSGAQTVKATGYNNLVLSGTGTNAKTTTGITVYGTLTMEGTATTSVVPSYGATATLVYNAATARSSGLEWPAQFTPTGGIVINNTGAITIAANKLLQAGVPLTINANATLTTGNSDLSLRDDFVNNGTWTSSTGDVTVTGTAGQFIGSFSTTGGFISTKTGGGVATVTGAITAGALTVNGSTGTINLGTGLNHEIFGTVALSSGSLNGGSSTLKVGGAWAGTGTLFQAGTGTVVFYRAAQTLSASGAKTFYNLTFSGGGNKTTNAGTTVVNNILSLEDIAAPASTFPTYGTNAQLRYNTATPRTAGAEWLATFTAAGGVVIENTGTISIGANKVFGTNAPFTIENGATFNAGNFDMAFGNNFIKNGTGVWTSNTGDVTVQGAGNQSIAGFTTTGLFNMLKSGGTATMQGNANSNGFVLNGANGTLDLGTGLTHTFNGTYTNTAGIVNGNTSTMNLAADVASSGGGFIPATGTVNFTGNITQAVPPVTWYNVGFSGTGLKVMVGEGGASNVMTIEPGATVDMGAFTFILAGANNPLVINGNGALIASTSIIGFTNAGSVNIPALDYYSLYGSTGGPRVLSSTGTTRIAGTFTPGGGVYDVTGSTVDFNGSIDQPIPTFTFNKLIVSNSGIKKILASVIVGCQSIDINDNASVEINTDGAGRLNVTGP